MRKSLGRDDVRPAISYFIVERTKHIQTRVPFECSESIAGPAESRVLTTAAIRRHHHHNECQFGFRTGIIIKAATSLPVAGTERPGT